MLNEIICGDCLEVMKEIPDKSIDLILTDPPYGVNLEYESYEDTEENWENLFLSFIPQAKRIAKMVIMPSCKINKLEFIYKNHPPDWLICWYKGSPGTNGYIGFNDWEPLLVYNKTNKIAHDYLSTTNKEKLGNYGHPCPKPINWAYKLINMVTNKGDLILDPFAGSCTTALAAIKSGRDWICIEKEQNYCDIGRKRISNYHKSTPIDLFAH
jgi:site-specific DNA-methyltransferase (adenine-specific)